MELAIRGCEATLIDSFLHSEWTDMKAWLKKHEKKRVKGLDSGAGDVDRAAEGFKPLSMAPFKDDE